MVGPVPATGRMGLSETEPHELGTEVLSAWDAFVEVARSAQLSRPSRLPGWTGRDTCVHLGSWADSRMLDRLVDSARTGDVADVPHPDAHNEVLLQAHRDASDAEVLDALRRARERVARFFADEAQETGRLLAGSTVGPLPLLSLVHAGTYELAVHALDLAPCGARAPAPQLLDRGLAALIDVTGALSARSGVDIALTAMTPSGGWRFTSGGTGWTTERVGAGQFAGVGVRGSAADLLDASAGRTGLPQLLLSRRMAVQQLPQWMRLAPLLDDVPGLPGGVALKAGIAGLSSVVGGVGRVLGRFTR